MRALFVLLAILICGGLTQGAWAEQGPNHTPSHTLAKAGGRKLGVGMPAVPTGSAAPGRGSKSLGRNWAAGRTFGPRPGSKGSSSIDGTNIRASSSSVNGTEIRSKHWPRFK